MASIDNNVHKKQKKTKVVSHDDEDSPDDSLSLPLSLPTPVVVVLALSVGNILKEFPDFLFCLLPYISDRVIWNSIASSNKDMYEKSKTIQPPWPLCYKLPSDDSPMYPYPVMAWSPDGTRIACRHDLSNIVIFDQRLGPLHNHRNAHDEDIITVLKYSPNGSYLVSIGRDSFVRLWGNVTGNFTQLQEWNMEEELVEDVTHDISETVYFLFLLVADT